MKINSKKIIITNILQKLTKDFKIWFEMDQLRRVMHGIYLSSGPYA